MPTVKYKGGKVQFPYTAVGKPKAYHFAKMVGGKLKNNPGPMTEVKASGASGLGKAAGALGVVGGLVGAYSQLKPKGNKTRKFKDGKQIQ